MKSIKIILATLVIGMTGALLNAEEGKHGDHKKVDSYPLSICVVSDEPLGEMGEQYIYNHEGREVRFCCKGCKKDFLKEPAKFLAKLDAAKADKAKEGNPKGKEAAKVGEHHKKSETSKKAKDSHAGHHH